jgi:glycosyltransferase involved in cell wall biosynthesis
MNSKRLLGTHNKQLLLSRDVDAKYHPQTKSSYQLTLDGHAIPTSWPSVTLCMIVKNEENHLASCLNTIQGFPSEVIIVDTGSTDRTVEIAQAMGAKVKQFTWIDDFAAARNASIEEAKGKWIFWLDADDRISPDNLIRLKQWLTFGQADVYACQIASKNLEVGSARTSVRHLRLFRNGVGLQFFGSIHESLALAKADRKLIIADTNIVIEHTGYEVDKQMLRAKARRNLAIIQQCIDEEPENLHWQHHLGISLSMLGDYAKAAHIYEAVIARPPSTLSFEVDIYQAYIALMYAYLRFNEPIKARTTVERALQAYPDRRHLAVTAGMFYLDQDEPDKAVRLLERAKTLSPASDNWGHVWPAGILEGYLGQAYLLLGKLNKARQLTEASFALMNKEMVIIPGDLQVEAEQLFEAKAYHKVITLLKHFSPDDPGILRMLARSARQLFLWDDATRHLERALALSDPQPDEWSALAAWHILKTGKTRSAKRLCQLALADDHTDTKAKMLLDFVESHPEDFWCALSDFIQSLLININDQFNYNELSRVASLFELTPTELLYQYGIRLLSQKIFEEASEVFGLIVSLSPSNAEAYKSLAVALQGMGREGDALLVWQVSQKLGRNLIV